MKTHQLQHPKKRDWLDHLDHVRYFTSKGSEPYKPMHEKNGIHCTGDRFNYIVDWQVGEKEQKPSSFKLS
jgi:hypothetical protein